MDYRSDVATIIIRRQDLSHKQKTFLLWCWIKRDSDERCDIISTRRECNLSERSFSWYADYFGMDVRNSYRDIFVPLKKNNVIKTRICRGGEVVYVDFTVFK